MDSWLELKSQHMLPGRWIDAWDIILFRKKEANDTSVVRKKTYEHTHGLVKKWSRGRQKGGQWEGGRDAGRRWKEGKRK